MGIWTAYDPGLAWRKFWLILAAVILYYAVALQADGRRLIMAFAIFGVCGAVLTIYFFAANDWTLSDWSLHARKIPIVITLAQRIATWFPQLASHSIAPDMLGGMAATVLPVYIPLVVLSRSRTRSILWLVAAGLTGLSVLISTSYGAWLAVLSVMGVWAASRGVGWWAGRRRVSIQNTRRARVAVLVLLALVGLAVLAAVVLVVPPGQLPGTIRLADRIRLARESLPLARDYVWTGAGLGMFPLQFSVYTLLIHVPYATHSHNVLVDLVIEQGLVGLVSYVSLFTIVAVTGLRHLGNATDDEAWMLEAGLAGLSVTLVTGLFDDALYGSQGVLLLFVPLGIVMAAVGIGRGRSPANFPSSKQSWRNKVARLGIALLGVAVIGLIAWRPILAAWYANLGALDQSRIELRAYDPNHFDSHSLDQVRRSENLDNAIRLLQAAIRIDPAQPTARQRLAGIALSRGDYAAGLEHMQAAWNAGYRDAVTRMLLGDADIATGRPQEAAQVTKGLSRAADRFKFQAWYRYWLKADYVRSADAWTAAVLLNPSDSQSVSAQAEAMRQAGK